MSYIDKVVLQDHLLSENKGSLRKMMASVDKKRVEQDILKDKEAGFQPFLCTYDAKEEVGEKMTPDDHDLLCELYELVQGSKMEARRGLKKLAKLKAKYPNMPIVYNFISTAYQTLKQEKKNYHTIKVTCKKFPDYVFGKIALAEHRLEHGHYEEVPEIFNHKLQLYMHYPNEEKIPAFHGSEVQAFYTVMGRYYARIQKIACAIKCYFLVEEANSDSPHLDIIAQEIFAAEMALFMMGGFGKLDND